MPLTHSPIHIALTLIDYIFTRPTQKEITPLLLMLIYEALRCKKSNDIVILLPNQPMISIIAHINNFFDSINENINQRHILKVFL